MIPYIERQTTGCCPRSMTGTDNTRYEATYVSSSHGDNRVIPVEADEFQGRESGCRVASFHTARPTPPSSPGSSACLDPDAELNAAYLDWKYHQNPYIREPLIYLAFVDEQLVGMRGVFGTRWEVGEPSESFTLPYADDLVIDPGFRRGGVHGQLMRFALDDLERRGYRYLINLTPAR